MFTEAIQYAAQELGFFLKEMTGVPFDTVTDETPVGTREIVLGNTDRAVMYGVYTFLELELGCRFLSKDVSHVPGKTELQCAFTSRKYDPPLEPPPDSRSSC